uniref:Uncharacterized protein n=1 Tax=Peronospora matthiolae TaxID=2874970 RepID=A0AAV1UBB5_9STRA
MNGMPVRYTAKQQGEVTLSTMEAEFVATLEQARELLGIKKMLCELGKWPVLPMPPHVDN